MIFNPTAEAELALPRGKPTNEANAEIEKHLLTAEMKTRKCSELYKTLHTFMIFTHEIIIMIYFF